MTQLTYPAGRRAAVLSDFGEPDNLSIRELPTPTLRSDEMLVRVKATSVNPFEWKMRRGLGLPKPVWRLLIGRPMILGIDFSGTVVAVGSDVIGYQIGDDVMGAFRLWGADAEYVVVRLRSRIRPLRSSPLPSPTPKRGQFPLLACSRLPACRRMVGSQPKPTPTFSS
jgi:NADPH-dependent curcumin reductase CurA